VIRQAPSGTVIGALVILHEVGHALGLEHSSSFAVKRNGLTAPAVRWYVSRQRGLELRAHGRRRVRHLAYLRLQSVLSKCLHFLSGVARGQLIDNNVNPLNGDLVWFDPLMACPGDVVNFLATVGNDSAVVDVFDVSVYLDPDVNGYPHGSAGALNTVTVSMGKKGVRTLES